MPGLACIYFCEEIIYKNIGNCLHINLSDIGHFHSYFQVHYDPFLCLVISFPTVEVIYKMFIVSLSDILPMILTLSCSTLCLRLPRSLLHNICLWQLILHYCLVYLLILRLFVHLPMSFLIMNLWPGVMMIHAPLVWCTFWSL